MQLCEEELQKTQTKLVEKSEESEDYYNEWFRAQDERDIAERREHQIELELNELKEEVSLLLRRIHITDKPRTNNVLI